MSSIEERLKAAEDLCVMYAWTPARHETDRDKAAHALWRRWVEVSGNECTTEENPHLTDELISELARRRDETRADTMRRLFSDTPGGDS